ncbi:MAG: hypothetical protein KJ017_11520 [Alphaproteobacteria bacterium]|nr:hypothetical protein [Alphaproteobacteria bacterium]
MKDSSKKLIRILMPVSSGWAGLPENTEKALDTIIDGKFLLPMESFFHDSNLQISFKKIARDSLKHTTSEHPIIKQYLEASCLVKIDSKLINAKKKFLWKHKEDELKSYLLHTIDEVIEYLLPFIICCNLAAPSVLNCYENIIVYVDQEICFYPFSFGHEFHEFLDDESVFYKNLKILDIPETWNWITKQSGFVDGQLSNTNVSRAICAFCHLFNIEPSYLMSFPNYFIWSMLGLEALYADGTQGISYQLKNKASLIFNFDAEQKNRINKLYDHRSRFFHGQTNLWNPWLLGILSSDAVQKEHKQAEFHYEAFILFLISLQFCAENKLNSLDFGYIHKK